MPKILPGDTKKKWMTRCIPYVIKAEGLKPAHAVAKCSGMWDQHKKKTSKQ